jgi:hypothetical protein
MSLCVAFGLFLRNLVCIIWNGSLAGHFLRRAGRKPLASRRSHFDGRRLLPIRSSTKRSSVTWSCSLCCVVERIHDLVPRLRKKRANLRPRRTPSVDRLACMSGVARHRTLRTPEASRRLPNFLAGRLRSDVSLRRCLRLWENCAPAFAPLGLRSWLLARCLIGFPRCLRG